MKYSIYMFIIILFGFGANAQIPDETFLIDIDATYETWECIRYDPYDGQCEEWGWVTHSSHYKGDLYKVKSTKTSINKNSMLIVEGFDANNSMYFPELWEAFNRQNLAECILDNGYDIFILNFHNPTQSIYKNAEIVKEAINKIKNEIQNTNNELIVVGGSMGGLVTRVALRDMELSEENTQTRLWVSFDSPQKGANIPLGVQYLINQLIYELPSDKTEDLKTARNVLRSVAAKQMLLYHFDYDGSPAPEFTSFFNDINSKGLPETSRNIAITNGASDGTGQGFNPETLLLSFYVRK